MSDQRVPIPGSELQPRVGERWLPDDATSQTLTVSIFLRHHAGSAASEDNLLSGAYHPESRESAAAAMAADPGDLEMTRAFAEQYGLQIIDENKEARRIQVRGTAAQLDKAFGVQLRWADGADGQRYLTYGGSITVPQDLDGVVTAVLGLDRRPVAKHHSS